MKKSRILAGLLVMGTFMSGYAGTEPKNLAISDASIAPTLMNKIGVSGDQPRPAVASTLSVVSLVTKAKLDSLTHKFNTKLYDKLRKDENLIVMEQSVLKNKFPAKADSEGIPYDFEDKATLNHFKDMGVEYVLVATFDDMEERSEIAASAGVTYHLNDHGDVVWDLRNNRAPGVSGNRQLQTGTTGGTITWVQKFSVTMRLQLFDVKKGRQPVVSENKKFDKKRTNRVDIKDINSPSFGDMYDSGLSEAVNNWYSPIVEDKINPMKITKREGEIVTINSGNQAGFLRAGQSLEVKLYDKDDDDYTKLVGHINIDSVNEKTSKARITDEQLSGIIIGGKVVPHN